MTEIKQRSHWLAAARDAKQAKNVSQFMIAVYKLLTEPQYRQHRPAKWDTVTGKVVDYKWCVDKQSVVKNLTIRKYDFDDYALKPQLALMLDVLKSSGRSDIYAPVEDDKANAHKIVTVHATYEQTGGGHNDSPTYDYVLCFTVGNLNKIVLY